jgi:hypothetical protein
MDNKGFYINDLPQSGEVTFLAAVIEGTAAKEKRRIIPVGSPSGPKLRIRRQSLGQPRNRRPIVRLQLRCVVKVRGAMEHYNDKPQLIVSRIRRCEPQEYGPSPCRITSARKSVGITSTGRSDRVPQPPAHRPRAGMVLHFEIAGPGSPDRLQRRTQRAATPRFQRRGPIPAVLGQGQVLFYLGGSGFVKEFRLPRLLPFLELNRLNAPRQAGQVTMFRLGRFGKRLARQQEVSEHPFERYPKV